MNNRNSGLKRDDETMDTLFHGSLSILQKKKGYRFSVDSPLLAHFATLRKGERVVDLGTGSGVIAMILALRFPETKIAEVEIQQELADMAERNIALNGLGDRIRVHPGDVKGIRETFAPKSFDAAVFNPPYRRLNSGKINPNYERAVARHEITGTIDDFLAAARYLLKDYGRAYVIYPASRGVQLIAGMRRHGMEPKKIRIVYSDSLSGAVFILAEGVKGAGEEVEIMPPLFIYGSDGGYSDEMDRMLGGASLAIPS